MGGYNTDRYQHVACVCSEVDDCIGGPSVLGLLIVTEAEVRCQGVEDLSTVGEIGLEGEDSGILVWELGEIHV